jgi:hypothetical protein
MENLPRSKELHAGNGLRGRWLACNVTLAGDVGDRKRIALLRVLGKSVSA